MQQRIGGPQSIAGKRKPQQTAPLEYIPTNGTKVRSEGIERSTGQSSGMGTPCHLELGLRDRPGEQRCRQVCVQTRPKSRVQCSLGWSRKAQGSSFN